MMFPLITNEKLDSIRRLVLLNIALTMLFAATFAAYFALKQHNEATAINVTLGLKKAGE